MTHLVAIILVFGLALNGCAHLYPSHYLGCLNTSEPHSREFGSPSSDRLIIFVHGLCGDSKNTWTNTSSDFDFPNELAKDLNAHVVSFDYTSYLGGDPTILNISKYLDLKIGELLDTHNYTSISFVAHSMGGLVAREYILRRHTHSHPDVPVTHLILLAVPNDGSDLAKLKIIVPSNRQMSELNDLETGNSYLESLNDSWTKEFRFPGHSRHLLTYAAYEEQSLLFVGKVVTRASAIAPADEYVGIQEDHISISKPANREASAYQWVKRRLQVIDPLVVLAKPQLVSLEFKNEKPFVDTVVLGDPNFRGYWFNVQIHNKSFEDSLQVAHIKLIDVQQLEGQTFQPWATAEPVYLEWPDTKSRTIPPQDRVLVPFAHIYPPELQMLIDTKLSGRLGVPQLRFHVGSWPRQMISHIPPGTHRFKLQVFFLKQPPAEIHLELHWPGPQGENLGAMVKATTVQRVK